jgi:hypothetical protein
MNIKERREAILGERLLANRIRSAVQFCKDENNVLHMADSRMTAPERMQMERCLVQNYLLKFGMDYFGKRDLIYIDMQGDRDAGRQNTKEYIPRVKIPKAPKKGAVAAAEDEGEDAGDEEEE